MLSYVDSLIGPGQIGPMPSAPADVPAALRAAVLSDMTNVTSSKGVRIVFGRHWPRQVVTPATQPRQSKAQPSLAELAILLERATAAAEALA